MDEKLITTQLKKMFGQASGAVMPDEFKEVITTILEVIKELRIYLEKEMTAGDSETMKACKSTMSQVSDMEDRMSEMMKNKADIKQVLQGVMSELSMIKTNMPTMPDLSVLEAKIAEIKASIPVIKDTILDTPIQIREKVQSLPEGERWEMEDVNGLRKEIDTLRQEIQSMSRGGGGRTTSGRLGGTAFEKLTLNGVTKTFFIPNLRNVVAIMGTSFPTVFAPTTDYTVANLNVTFTDSVDASTTLAADQTVIVIYNQLHY